jgi:hypothetical protein
MRETLRSMSCIITLSVNSRIRLPGAIWVSCNTSRISSMNAGRWSWNAETFTEIDSIGSRGHSCWSSTACSQASLRMWRPRGTIRPVSSTSGMNSAGETGVSLDLFEPLDHERREQLSLGGKLSVDAANARARSRGDRRRYPRPARCGMHVPPPGT